MTQLSTAVLSDRLHVRVVGSYVRGKADCGDIDYIIAPGPAAGEEVAIGRLLDLTLKGLSAKGYVTGDGGVVGSKGGAQQRGGEGAQGIVCKRTCHM